MKNKWDWENIQFYINVAIKAGKKFLFYLVCIGILGIGLFGGIGAGYFVGLVEDMSVPTKETFAGQINSTQETSTIAYNDGKAIGTLRSDLVRTNVPLADISPLVVNGLIATEDENFYSHHGVVPSAIMRAFVSQFANGGSSSGGSTITQQLIKQRLLTNEVSMERKAKEILLSLRLEHDFSKEQILESYLNVSPYGRNNKGENIAGIEEAAQGIFGISASELNLAQAAYLVGMPQNPYTYTPFEQDGSLKNGEDLNYGLTRRKEVLKRMLLEEMITQSEYDEALAYDVTNDFIGQDTSEDEDTDEDRSTFLYQAIERETKNILFDYIVQRDGLSVSEVKNDPEQNEAYTQEADSMMRNNGLTIQSTINADIYETMNNTVQNYGQTFGPTYTSTTTDSETGETIEVTEPVQNGSVLLENKTGRVLGFVGGVDFDISQVDHAFSSRRSPGSTFKPLLTYGPAIEEGIATPSTLLADTYMKAKQADGSYYEPSNFGSTISHSFLTAREALARSLNNPTIYLYNELLTQGVDVASYAKKLGLAGAISDEEYQNIALSVGGTATGPTVSELAGAYATFSNDGQYIAPYLIESITDGNGNQIYKHESKPVQVYSPDTAYIISDMLREVISTGTWSDVQGQLDTSFDFIVKTGTSEDTRDLWVSGSTPTVTLTSWIGYDNLTQSRNLSDDAPASTYGEPSKRHSAYWINLMNNLGAEYPEEFGANQTRKIPEGVHEESVVADTGTLPGSFDGPYGTSYTIGDNATMTTDLFPADMSPKQAIFNFAIGGKVDELVESLESYRNPGNGEVETTVNNIRQDYAQRKQENEQARQQLATEATQ